MIANLPEIINSDIEEYNCKIRKSHTDHAIDYNKLVIEHDILELRKYLVYSHPNDIQKWQIEMEETEVESTGMTRAQRRTCDVCNSFGYFETYTCTIIKKECCFYCIKKEREAKEDKDFKTTMILKKNYLFYI